MCVVLAAAAAASLAQGAEGELRLTVLDPSGRGAGAAVEIAGVSSPIARRVPAREDGGAVFRNLPFGTYRYKVSREGFSPASGVAEIRSPLPVAVTVTLAIGAVETTIDVTTRAALVEARRIGSEAAIGVREIEERVHTGASRALPALMAMQPGWILEANGVLHPRGSEYQVQYVVDGLPLTDNRSPSFAPPFDADEVQSIRALTAGYPAEYGRKLGGVIEVNTAPESQAGFHGKGVLGGGSFDSTAAYLGWQYGWGGNALGGTFSGNGTSRYLDPPVAANLNNHATAWRGGVRGERDWRPSERTTVSLSRGVVRFQAPNELRQHAAGQRQDRKGADLELQARHHRVLTPSAVFSARAMYQDVSAALWSNLLSDPVAAWQDRGFRQGYFGAWLAGRRGGHHWRAGGDAIAGSIREAFSYRITDPGFYGGEAPPEFSFAGRGRNREASLYVSDRYALGDFTFSGGLRYDAYSLLVEEHAVSPRLGVSYHVRGAGLTVHAAYDRIFQTPAIENLLLSSSSTLAGLGDETLLLPVKPSRGHFYEIGASKALAGRFRLNVAAFRRDVANLEDDELLFNTGVAFPIAFSRARVQGIEAALALPSWGPVSGSLAYANQHGVGWLPVTGGLFLDDADELLHEAGRFPISQDQRNTASARVRCRLTRFAWVASEAHYGSGLPTEIESEDWSGFQEAYGSQVLGRVNLERGRVRPSFALNLSAGVTLWRREGRSATLQGDLANVTNRLNVINFAGLFSGTAIAPPRSGFLRLTWLF